MRAATFRPQSADQLGAFLAKADCNFEIKLDGVRVIADCRGPKPTMHYRSGLPADFRELVEPLKAHPSAVFDGEVVAFDDAGRPSFSTLAPRLHMRSGAHSVVCYLVFDLLYDGGEDLTGLPLAERRDRLEAISFATPLVRVHPALGDGLALLEFARTHKLEGIVRKERKSPYVFGPKTSDSWQKLKFEREDDFVITGYVTNGTRLVSLEIASFTQTDLVLRARVGSGLSDAVSAFLLETLPKEAARDCAAVGELPPIARGDVRNYVTPKHVVSVRYQEWTPDGHLRMPTFRGLRVDVRLEDCAAEPEK